MFILSSPGSDQTLKLGPQSPFSAQRPDQLSNESDRFTSCPKLATVFRENLNILSSLSPHMVTLAKVCSLLAIGNALPKEYLVPRRPRSPPSRTSTAGTRGSGRRISAASGAPTARWASRTTSPSACSPRTSRCPSRSPGRPGRTPPAGRSSMIPATAQTSTSCCAAPELRPPRCCGLCTPRPRQRCASGAWSDWP
nr:uncharacterized protein C8orf90 homolog isoform X1 [Pongo pygmaeus]